MALTLQSDTNLTSTMRNIFVVCVVFISITVITYLNWQKSNAEWHRQFWKNIVSEKLSNDAMREIFKISTARNWTQTNAILGSRADYLRDNASNGLHIQKSKASRTSFHKTTPKSQTEVKNSKIKPKSWCEHLKDQYPLVTNFSLILEKGGHAVEGVRPVHLHPYHYLHNASQTCDTSQKNLTLVCVVKSKVSNFELRRVIRNTWASEAIRDGNKVVFSLGSSKDKAIQQNVTTESTVYKDIVQENFVDNYYNNSLKTIMGIRWISTFCQSAIFVLMVDDDVMVNYRNLVSFFKSVSDMDRKSLFSGNRKSRPGPMRGKGAKWHMPYEQFPYDCYPPYLSGGAHLMSGEVVRKFSSALPYVKRFKYDDVYLSIVAQKIEIVPKHNSRVKMYRMNPKQLRNVIVSHGYSKPKDYAETYKNMTVKKDLIIFRTFSL